MYKCKVCKKEVQQAHSTGFTIDQKKKKKKEKPN